MREAIRCDCHEPEDARSAKMAERDGSRIIIRDRQHGVHHTKVIDLEREARKLQEEEN